MRGPTPRTGAWGWGIGCEAVRPLPRLDKTGEHVLCAGVSCGKPLADLVPAPRGAGSWLVLDFGWSYDQRSNIWQVTDRAAARRARGNTLLYRRGVVQIPSSDSWSMNNRALLDATE